MKCKCNLLWNNCSYSTTYLSFCLAWSLYDTHKSGIKLFRKQKKYEILWGAKDCEIRSCSSFTPTLSCRTASSKSGTRTTCHALARHAEEDLRGNVFGKCPYIDASIATELYPTACQSVFTFAHSVTTTKHVIKLLHRRSITPSLSLSSEEEVKGSKVKWICILLHREASL